MKTLLAGLLACVVGCSGGSTAPTATVETIPSVTLADHYREHPADSPRTGKTLRVQVGQGVIRVNGSYVYRWPGGRRPALVFQLAEGSLKPDGTRAGTFLGQCSGLDPAGAGVVPGPAVVLVGCVFTPD